MPTQPAYVHYRGLLNSTSIEPTNTYFYTSESVRPTISILCPFGIPLPSHNHSSTILTPFSFMFNSATSQLTSSLQAKTVTTANSAMKQKAEAEIKPVLLGRAEQSRAHNEQKFYIRKETLPPSQSYCTQKNFKHLTP